MTFTLGPDLGWPERVSKEQPRQSSLQSAEPTSVLFFGGQFRGANRHFYYFYYTQCLKFEAIKPGLIGKIARPSESSNRKEFGGEAEQSWSCPAVASLGLITLASKAGNKPSRSFTVPGEGLLSIAFTIKNLLRSSPTGSFKNLCLPNCQTSRRLVDSSTCKAMCY